MESSFKESKKSTPPPPPVLKLPYEHKGKNMFSTSIGPYGEHFFFLSESYIEGVGVSLVGGLVKLTCTYLGEGGKIEIIEELEQTGSGAVP